MRILRVGSAAWSASAITLMLLLGACATEDGSSSDSGAGPGTCEEGSWSNNGCVAWSTCAPGTYVKSAPSATADRTCTACASGTFSTTANGSSCTPWTTCAPGSHVST